MRLLALVTVPGPVISEAFLSLEMWTHNPHLNHVIGERIDLETPLEVESRPPHTTLLWH